MARKFRTKEWAVMLFIANDNDLDTFTRKKLKEIGTVGSTTAADVIIQFDTRGTSAIRRMRLSRGLRFPLRKLQWETNTGDKRTLIRFIDLTLEDFHPKRAMFVMSNHGSGFAIANDVTPGGTRTHVRAPVFQVFDARERALIAPDTGRPVESSSDALDNLELKAALMSIVRKHGRLELIAFDACLMNTFEVAYQVRHAARVMVGSQSNIPVPGCRFTATLELMRDEAVSTADVAKAVVNNVTPVEFDQFSAMAAVDLGKADDLAEAITVLADALTKMLRNDPGAFSAISHAHLSALAFLDSETIDLFDFCQKLVEMVADEDVREAATDVQAAVEQFVLHKNPCGAVVEGARGISITLPRRSEISDTYRQLDFARETSWVGFLDTYLQQRFLPIPEEPAGIVISPGAEAAPAFPQAPSSPM